MLTYVARRILYSIPVILIASFLVFFFVHVTTDPLARFTQVQDPRVKTTEGLRLGLLEEPCHEGTANARGIKPLICKKTPVLKRYGNWLSHFLRGDLGRSFITGRPVSHEVRSHLGKTLELITWGALISALLATGIGVYSAVRQYSVLDYAFTGTSFVGLSMPPFWFGLIAIQLFAYTLPKTLGTGGPILCSIGLHGGCGSGIFDYARHLALPVATLTVQIVASWSRYQRSAMLDVMGSDFIRTAHAKGVSRARVVAKHALRNALIPLVTVMAIDIGALFGGLIITETIFSIPGMGQLFFTALQQGDTNVLLAWLMVAATFIILFNLFADVLYGVLDPRIRLS